MVAKRVLAEDDDDLLTPAELREWLKVSESTMNQWRWLNRGPRWIKVGRHVRYPRAAVREWLDAGADLKS